MKSARKQSVRLGFKTGISVLLGVLLLGGIGVSTANAAPLSLLLPQSTAFGYLGHSCGGIQEKAYATGFDSATGYPNGDVYIQTRCGGSGRGGGYKVTTYSAWVAASWNFIGGLLSSSKLAAAPTVNSTFFATDAYGDTIYNSNNVAYLTVPSPAAPTNVSAVQSGDQFNVACTLNGANPVAITSSTLTATPVGSSAPVLTTSISGSAAMGVISPLQPQTLYSITVVSTTIGGSSPASSAIYVTTAAASVAPSAPTGVTANWAGGTDTSATLMAGWNAASPGDSPIDQYQITINGSDGGGMFTQTVSGTTLTAFFTVDPIPDWTVTVRAHNTVRWGPWSAKFTLGGL